MTIDSLPKDPEGGQGWGNTVINHAGTQTVAPTWVVEGE